MTQSTPSANEVSGTGRYEWPRNALTRVPLWIYGDPRIFSRELERMFYGPTWNYVGFADEVPNAGDYKRAWIANKSVLLTRSSDGTLAVLENVCAHRGMQLVWTERGNGTDITCPYHQWCYSLKGDLQGVPFRRGVGGKGGYLPDFNPADHGIRRLKHVEHNGLVWASFAQDTPNFAAYCGTALPMLDRLLQRPVKVLGYQRQVLRCNWKMYMENLRDPYHATLLHTFYITFGLFRADNRSEIYSTEDGMHGITISENTGKKSSETTAQIRNFDDTLVLLDPDLVTPLKEFEDGLIGGPFLHPSIIVQHQANSLAIRHLVPRAPGLTELIWTFFGYQDDSEEMTLRRIKHANLVGPSGLVSLDDSEVLKNCQSAADSYPDHVSFIELGGRDTEKADHMMTETQIRAFYKHYRQVMDL